MFGASVSELCIPSGLYGLCGREVDIDQLC